MGMTGGGPSGGGSGGASRSIPKKDGDSFIYWDMLTKPDGTKLVPGESITAAGGIKNQGSGGSALDITAGTNSGDGAPFACSGPTGGGVDFGGVGSVGEGSLSTSGVNGPHADDDVVMSIAFRFRTGFGTGSPILWTKSYIAPGGGWSSPFNAIGFSLHSGLNGGCDYNVNVGGSNVGVFLGDRYSLDPEADHWIDLVKRADGTGAVFIDATKVKGFNPGALLDIGHGEWMLGGNSHTATDSCNAKIFFAELKTIALTDAQIMARAKAWLGWV